MSPKCNLYLKIYLVLLRQEYFLTSLGGFKLQDILLLLLQRSAHQLVPGGCDNNCWNKKHHPNYPTPTGFAHSLIKTVWANFSAVIGKSTQAPSTGIDVTPTLATVTLGKGTWTFHSLTKVCKVEGYDSLFCSSGAKTETMWTDLHDRNSETEQGFSLSFQACLGFWRGLFSCMVG